LNTNASLMTEEKALAAMEAGLDELNISFDGFSKETYEKIRVGLKYDEVMANIQSLLRLKKSRGSRNPLVRMTFVLFQENEKEAKAFFDHWRREVDDVVISYARDWAGQMKVESKSSPHLSASVPEKNPCDSLWQDMVVGYDGQVVLCCNDYDGKVSMGDLTRQTVSEVWFGDKFERYRSAQKGGSRKNLELCEGCSKFSFWE